MPTLNTKLIFGLNGGAAMGALLDGGCFLVVAIVV